MHILTLQKDLCHCFHPVGNNSPIPRHAALSVKLCNGLTNGDRLKLHIVIHYVKYKGAVITVTSCIYYFHNTFFSLTCLLQGTHVQFLTHFRTGHRCGLIGVKSFTAFSMSFRTWNSTMHFWDWYVADSTSPTPVSFSEKSVLPNTLLSYRTCRP